MRLFALVVAFAAAAAHAQQPDDVWLDSQAAAGFRARVVQLALIYGESDGIDLHDYKVQAKEVAKKDADCADVEVVVSKAGRIVRRETVRACRTH